MNAIAATATPATTPQTMPARDTAIDAIRRAIETDGDTVFLDVSGDRMTYREVEARSNQLARALARHGVQAGDTVVSFLDTSLDGILGWLALNKLGAIWAPVNTAYSGEFLRHQVTDSQAKLVLCEDHYLDRFLAIADDLPKVSRILVRGGMADSDDAPFAVAPFPDGATEKAGALDHVPRPHEISCLIYTSGTTGPSKGCMISHNYLCNVGRQQNTSARMRKGEVLWTCLPLFHIGSIGVVITSIMLSQGTACLAPRFSVSQFWDEIERTGATIAMMVATMFPFLAQAPDSEPMLRCKGQLRAVFGIPITEDVRQQWMDRFGVSDVVGFSFGQTEVCKVCNYSIGDPLPPAGSCGPIAEDFIVQIVDEQDLPVPTGTSGEIVVRPRRPDIMFSGYWNRPEDTARVWRNLWMHTGDIGRMDEEGNLYFVDRKKDYLRRRGENISSFEIEAALMAHPAVSLVAIYGVDVPGGVEEDIKLSVLPRDGMAIDPAELWHWARERIPYFAMPRFIEVHEDFPRTPTGKIEKYLLRRRGLTDASWDAQAQGLSSNPSARRRETA